MVEEPRADDAGREPPSDHLGVASALRGGSGLLALRTSQVTSAQTTSPSAST